MPGRLLRLISFPGISWASIRSEPGFKRAMIEPQLCELAFVEGKMPTPHGIIEARAERQGKTSSLQVSLPDVVSAQVRLPASPKCKVSLVGTPAAYRYEDQVMVIELPAGAQVKIELQEP